ncbi:hypothetical protein GCM10009541_56940 [Micromonospora gifhornensis]
MWHGNLPFDEGSANRATSMTTEVATGYTVGQPDPCRPLLGRRSTAHPTGCRPRRNVSSWLQLSPRTPVRTQFL